MDMTGEYRIPAPRETVWQALNDPDVLRASIPGCEELTQVSPTELNAKVTAKIGPVKQKFNGGVHLENINAPSSYTLRGEGKGTAGFAKGSADVQLEDEGQETVLRYQAHADIGGKLAQLGSRLVHGSAKKMADDFFSNFVEHVSDAHKAKAGAPAPAAAPPAAEEPAAAAPERTAAPAERGPEPGGRAATAAEAARRATEKHVAGGAGEKPIWQRPVVWVAVVVVLLLIVILS